MIRTGNLQPAAQGKATTSIATALHDHFLGRSIADGSRRVELHEFRGPCTERVRAHPLATPSVCVALTISRPALRDQYRLHAKPIDIRAGSSPFSLSGIFQEQSFAANLPMSKSQARGRPPNGLEGMSLCRGRSLTN
jgi:hypothetical protein